MAEKRRRLGDQVGGEAAGWHRNFASRGEKGGGGVSPVVGGREVRAPSLVLLRVLSARVCLISHLGRALKARSLHPWLQPRIAFSRCLPPPPCSAPTPATWHTGEAQLAPARRATTAGLRSSYPVVAAARPAPLQRFATRTPPMVGFQRQSLAPPGRAHKTEPPPHRCPTQEPPALPCPPPLRAGPPPIGSPPPPPREPAFDGMGARSTL
jgi:hypothetical protein